MIVSFEIENKHHIDQAIEKLEILFKLHEVFNDE